MEMRFRPAGRRSTCVGPPTVSLSIIVQMGSGALPTRNRCQISRRLVRDGLKLPSRFEQLVRRVPLLVAFEEQLGSNHSARVDDERSGLRQPSLVEDTEGFDHLTFRVGKQRKLDGLARGELLQLLGGIRADPHDLQAGCFEVLSFILQLDQLLFAERSPIGRTVENERHIPLLEQRRQRAILSVLIFERERRSFRTHFEPGAGGR